MGHITSNCPQVKYQIRKGKNKIHHAHAAKDDEPILKKERKMIQVKNSC